MINDLMNRVTTHVRTTYQQADTQVPVKIMKWDDYWFVIINLEIGGLLYHLGDRQRWGGTGDAFDSSNVMRFLFRGEAEEYIRLRPQMQLIPQGELA